MRKILSLMTCAVILLSCSVKEGRHTLVILETSDVHGAWFSTDYNGNPRSSLMSLNTYVDSVRAEHGRRNVLLLDAGDCLQGDNATFYYNYVDTVADHLYPRLAEYMHYDAVAVGNHDIETGHGIYDRIAAVLGAKGIPMLAANAVQEDGSCYFQPYTIVRRAGLKVAVIGFTNANIKAWLSERYWSGMDFQSLTDVAQSWVDQVRREQKPQVVIVLTHSGTGTGDGSILEAQGLDMLKTLRGVDFLVTSHDHRARIEKTDSICMLNSGSHARSLAEGVIELDIRHGQVVSRKLDAKLIQVDPLIVDERMRAKFEPEYRAVYDFSHREVGELPVALRTRDGYTGMCPYLDLLHSVSLDCPEAQVSLAAPLKYDSVIPAGPVEYNDLFTIYPYENQLYVVRLKGSELLSLMELSYDRWINTYSGAPESHLLKIVPGADKRNGGSVSWHFANPSFNFDSAGGLCYTVDVTRPYGSRVSVQSMSDGSDFSVDSEYNVAMTSYRASGLESLIKGWGNTPDDELEGRIVARYPSIRKMVYYYISEGKPIRKTGLGEWKFVPESLARPALEKDMALLFGESH
ncbi:MAG: bifunctional metallophosphatase/5'-nucleotidase [Bacteroidales bacterium]|nr:bifunctional metallophosphatase/5'-nucleotidase [Bacteroidales bacterium]